MSNKTIMVYLTTHKGQAEIDEINRLKKAYRTPSKLIVDKKGVTWEVRHIDKIYGLGYEIYVNRQD